MLRENAFAIKKYDSVFLLWERASLMNKLVRFRRLTRQRIQRHTRQGIGNCVVVRTFAGPTTGDQPGE